MKLLPALFLLVCGFSSLFYQPNAFGKEKKPRPILFSYNYFAAEAKDYIRQMSLDEEIGQMTLPTVKFLLNDGGLQLISQYHIGGVVAVDGSGLLGGERDLTSWQALAQQINSYPVFVDHSPIRIPLLLGTDAVHGNQRIANAVVFPHNIGMGATHDIDLLEKVGAWTAYDVRKSGFNWIYTPFIAIPNDYHWKQIYESFGSDPKWVANLTESLVFGAQAIKNRFLHGTLATAKYIDIADATNVSINADVGSILVPYNTSTLNDKFPGLVVTKVIRDKHSTLAATLAKTVNSGTDMFIINNDDPQTYQTIANFQTVLKQDVQRGLIPKQRIENAVQHILQVKLALGLFEPKHHTLSRPSYDESAIARQVAQESLVLLKNDHQVLPLKRSRIEYVIFLGDLYDDIGSQCGEQTIEQDGVKGNEYWNGEYADKKASSIKTGIAKQLRGNTTYLINPDPNILLPGLQRYIYTAKNTVVITALGESKMLTTNFDPATLAAIKLVKQVDIPVVTVLLSGRPLIITQNNKGENSADAPLNISDVFIAAWLPGTTGGDAIANALFGRYYFQHKDLANTLPFPWPKSLDQTKSLSCGNQTTRPLFDCLYGLKD